MFGRTINEALKRAGPERARGLTHSFDMLGEAAMTFADAERYRKAYLHAIERLKDESDGTISGSPGISVKLTALYPKYDIFHAEKAKKALIPIVTELAVRARDANIHFTIDAEEADKLAKKMAKGQFDMNDLRAQLNQMRRMGGLGALAGMLPGLKKAQAAMANSGANDKTLIHLDAMIGSMTPKERERPAIINAKRKIRIAKGSGTTVQEVNRLLKMHQEMESAMKKIRKMGGLKGLAKMFGGGGMGGLGGAGGPEGGTPPDLSGLGGLGGLGGTMPKLPPGFQNFMKK